MNKKNNKNLGTKRGGSGNVIFLDEKTAKKMLRGKTNIEKRNRFQKEIEVLLCLKDEYPDINNVTKIYDYDLIMKPPWFTMKKYDGNSSDLLPRTRGNVIKTTELMLPIVKSLAKLSSCFSLYHRDLKPENLLYEKVGDEVKLILADFGCAIFKSDDEGRITDEFRAVGAMAYRAPEYHHGRVKNINEKGDIFSIGKLLWYFVNGVKNEVFPYTLWFPEEYSIVVRFPENPLITKISLIIANATHHDPASRLNYENLIAMLEEILKDNPITIQQEYTKLQVEESEAKELLYLQNKQVYLMNFVYTVFNDIKLAFHNIITNYPKSRTVLDMYNEFTSATFNLQNRIDLFVKNDINVPLFDISLPNLKLHCRLDNQKQQISEGKEILYNSYIWLYLGSKHLYCFTEDGKGLQMIFDNNFFTYDKEKFYTMLEWALCEKVKKC